MKSEIIIHSETDLKSKIYTIRGMQVMLDFDLAEIYGYTTKRFNEQVRNNIEKFDEDFRFQLTWEELEIILSLRLYRAGTLHADGIFHDRYVILDFGTKNEKIYHCGASSKDAGKKVCTISTITDNAVYKPLIKKLLKNRELVSGWLTSSFLPSVRF